MRRAALWLLAAAVAGAAVLLLVPRTPPESPALRDAPAIPKPTLDEKIAYFGRLFGSAETVEVEAPLAGATALEIPVWHDIAGPALLGLGEPALRYLASPGRYASYLAAPNTLASVLELLEKVPPFEGLFPFLAHWLDDGNCPRAVPGSDWPDEIRNLVFLVLKANPVPDAVPYCEAEFDRPRREHDVRGAAADILLRLGKADILNRVFASLPPTPDTPEPDLRISILDRLFQMAAPGAGDRSRAQVRALEPLLLGALESSRPEERLSATGVLWRLGQPGRKEEIERVFDENRETNEILAYGALVILSADGPDEFVHKACLRRIANPNGSVGFATAVRILANLWPEEILPKVLAWMRQREYIDPYMVLRELLRYDRADTVAWLRDEIRTAPDLARPLGFIANEGVTELTPDLLAMVREAEPARRPVLYQALVKLKAPGTEALLLAEMKASIPDDLKAAAATELLNLGEEAGDALLSKLLAADSSPVLDALLRRAWKSGNAVPEALVPSVLVALRTMPSEDGRRAALLVLRFRGRLTGVREGLVDAYRHEPSRRVAREIGAVIDELAHR